MFHAFERIVVALQRRTAWRALGVFVAPFDEAAALAVATIAVAQDVKFFRIGTGGTAGTYYPIGGMLANAISNPPGSRPCNDGGSCGAPGVVAIAKAPPEAVIL